LGYCPEASTAENDKVCLSGAGHINYALGGIADLDERLNSLGSPFSSPQFCRSHEMAPCVLEHLILGLLIVFHSR